MIILTEQLVNDNKKFRKSIDDEIALNKASLNSQKAFKTVLLDYMQKLATSTIVEPANSSKILKVLLSFKNSLELSNTNIINLENLLNLFADVKSMDKPTVLSSLSDINSTIIDLNDELFKNNSEILQTLKMTLSSSIQLTISDSDNNISETDTSEVINALEKDSENYSININNEDINIENINNNQTNNSIIEAIQENNIEPTSAGNTATEPIPLDTSSETYGHENLNTPPASEETTFVGNKTEAEISNINNFEIQKSEEKISNVNNLENQEPKEEITIQENTLIISEKTKKVFLPYSFSSLENLYAANPEEYSSVEDIIKKDYTLPLDLFKIPSVSRFREAYKLMREKENSSFKEALDLSFELFFNYNLHPAIISACRNLDELDIYLDYLADNETHKFNCFKIIFEITPTLTKYSFRRNKNSF